MMRGKMLSVLISVLRYNLVVGAYFTLTDVQVQIPRATDASKLATTPIIPTYFSDRNAIRDKNMRFTLKENETYLQINPTTGDVFFTPKFFMTNMKEIGKITATAYLEDIRDGSRDSAELEVSVLPLDALDCDKIVEDICFWRRATYRVEEESAPVSLGYLSSPYLKELCPYYNISYTKSSGGTVDILPPVTDKAMWALVATDAVPPTYKKKKSYVRFTCNIERTAGFSKGTSREITRDFEVQILDTDNHVPVSQDEEVRIVLERNEYKKDDIIMHRHLIFLDADSFKVNNYKADILNDGEKLLEPMCQKMRDSRNKKEQTAIHCKLVFTKDKIFTKRYSIVLQLNDTSLRSPRNTSVARLPVHLDPNTPQAMSLRRKSTNLYPSIVDIFRTAAPLARVAQADEDKCRGCSGFRMSEEADATSGRLFNITDIEGIVFVHDFVELRRSRAEYVKLNISWTRKAKNEHDIMEVRIVNEPNETCVNVRHLQTFEGRFCAQYESQDECLSTSACGIATGGSASVEKRDGPERCMWRGDKVAQNITQIYSTCTPDSKTCPDGKCDSLEQLNEKICPQDCTTDVIIPLSLNPRTNRGVDKASGIVVCHNNNRCLQMPKVISDDKEAEKKKKKLQSQQVSSSHLLNSNLAGNSSHGLIYDFQKAQCGTFCIIGTGLGIFFFGTIVATILICWRSRRRNEKLPESGYELTSPLAMNLTESTRNEDLPLQFNMISSFSMHDIIRKYGPDPKWEFPRSLLKIEQTLGEGEFGIVLRAKALDIHGMKGYTTVAVKTVKEDARETELNDLLSEFQLLKEISHPNVISLLGVCTSAGGPVYLIIEYAEYGSLRNYLRRSRKLLCDGNRISSTSKEENDSHYDEPRTNDVTSKDLLSFGWQICNGMSYLSDIKLVHRDLAARNVLLSTNKICKISDFGLTRDVYEDNAYLKRSKGRVPVKWMAPESLADHIYTTKSDVWSFGILIWELVTLGATPYPGIAVQNLFHLLKQGYRMERPDNCSPALYNIMRSCWNMDPESRPGFQELLKCWDKLLEDKMEYVNVSNNVIHNRGYFMSPFEDKEDNTIDDDSSRTSPVNYLYRTKSYEKCGGLEKMLDTKIDEIKDEKSGDVQGYETPVKVARKEENQQKEEREEYTDMSGRDKSRSENCKEVNVDVK